MAGLWGDRAHSFTEQCIGHKMEHKKVAFKRCDIVNIVTFILKKEVRLG